MGLQYNSTDVQGVQVKGKVGYTIVGSPTVTDGIASGFSSSNYMQVASNVANADITEIVLKAKLYDTALRNGNNYICYKTGGNLQFFIYAATGGTINEPSVYIPGPNASYNFTGFRPTIDSFFWLKYTYDGTTVRLYSKTDETDYTLRNTIENVSVTGTNGTWTIGNGSNLNSHSFMGEIDFNASYIKVKNKLWFWQPQPCKKVYYNGVLVWEYVPPYTQNWSNDQPSQHNTPVPLDAVGLTTGLISAVETDNLYEVSQGHNDAVGLTTGIISAVEEDVIL